MKQVLILLVASGEIWRDVPIPGMPSSHMLHPSNLLCITCLFLTEVLPSKEACFIHTTNFFLCFQNALCSWNPCASQPALPAFYGAWDEWQTELRAVFSQAAIGFVAEARSCCAPSTRWWAATVTIRGSHKMWESSLNLRGSTRAGSCLHT